jgi:hypothetical protein
MTNTTNAGPEPMFTAAMYGSAESARDAEVQWLRAENEALRAAIDRAETSYSAMLRADEKRLPGMTEYTRGWGGCLRAINAARAARGEG